MGRLVVGAHAQGFSDATLETREANTAEIQRHSPAMFFCSFRAVGAFSPPDGAPSRGKRAGIGEQSATSPGDLCSGHVFVCRGKRRDVVEVRREDEQRPDFRCHKAGARPLPACTLSQPAHRTPCTCPCGPRQSIPGNLQATPSCRLEHYAEPVAIDLTARLQAPLAPHLHSEL